MVLESFFGKALIHPKFEPPYSSALYMHVNRRNRSPILPALCDVGSHPIRKYVAQSSAGFYRW